jgi:hypothetical protein
MVPRTLVAFLSNLEIPFLYIRKGKGVHRYINLYALEATLFMMLRPGELSVKTPGADRRQRFPGVRKVPVDVLHELRNPRSIYHRERTLAGLAYQNHSLKDVRRTVLELSDHLYKDARRRRLSQMRDSHRECTRDLPRDDKGRFCGQSEDSDAPGDIETRSEETESATG